MKAVIVDIKDEYAAILSDDGSIRKIKNNKNYMIGQVVEMKNNKLHITKKLIAGIACAAVLMFTMGVSAWAYTAPYSYVSLDVNPSIEYTLNRFERVIYVKAVNDDGQVILDKIDVRELKNKTIKYAIVESVKQITEDGYFESNTTQVVSGSAIETDTGINTETNTVTGGAITMDGGIVITVSNGRKAISTGIAKEIKEVLDTQLDENVEIEVTSVSPERVQTAKEIGVTPGKLNLVEKLKASSNDPESIVLEEWLNKPVKDIMKAIKENRKENRVDKYTEEEQELAGEEQERAEEEQELAEEEQELAGEEQEQAEEEQEQAEEEQEKAEKKAKAKQEREEKKAKEEQERAEKKAKAEQERAEKKAKEEQEREEKKAKEEQEREEKKAKAEQERAEKKAKEEQERAEKKAKAEQERAEKKAKEEQERAEKKAEEEQERAEKKVKAEQERAEKKTKEEQESADKKAKQGKDNEDFSRKDNTPKGKGNN